MGQGNILFVDDKPLGLMEATTALKGHGYAVDICADASEAYESCARDPGRYGLVFMDIVFPIGPVGFGVSRAIARLRDRDGPIVVGMTGISELYDYERKEVYGMADMIMKPLFPWLLVNLAKQHCVDR